MSGAAEEKPPPRLARGLRRCGDCGKGDGHARDIEPAPVQIRGARRAGRRTGAAHPAHGRGTVGRARRAARGTIPTGRAPALGRTEGNIRAHDRAGGGRGAVPGTNRSLVRPPRCPKSAPVARAAPAPVPGSRCRSRCSGPARQRAGGAPWGRSGVSGGPRMISPRGVVADRRPRDARAMSRCPPRLAGMSGRVGDRGAAPRRPLRARRSADG